jgi:chemotaxis response regulator CheB
VQHIRAGFVDGMIKRLDGHASPRIVPAEDAQRPQPGHVYIAHDPRKAPCRAIPAIRQDAGSRRRHRPPWAPALGRCAVRIRGRPAWRRGRLLTGMGADGAEGLRRIRNGGGLTIAQNEATCVVYGMPRVAVERGAAELVLPLERIASRSWRDRVAPA